MTTTPRIFRNCALALPLVVVGSGAIGGTHVAAEVAVGGAFAVANLVLMAWVGSGFVREAAFGGSGIYGGALVAKMTLLVPLFLLLLNSIAPLHAVIGLCSALLAVMITGIELAFVDPGPDFSIDVDGVPSNVPTAAPGAPVVES